MAEKTVHLYVLDTYADWEPSFAIARLNDPAWQRAPGRFAVRTVADSRRSVRSMGGVTVSPDLTLDELAPADSALLILPGANTWDESAGANAVAKAAEFLRAGVPVAAICGATYGLATAGLLNRRRHTSNSLDFLLAAPGYRGWKLYEDRRVVADAGLITAPATGAVEFAAEIFSLLEVFDPEVIDGWRQTFGSAQPVPA